MPTSSALADVVPSGVIARVERLRRAGHHAVIEHADELTPDEIARYRCAACDGPEHPASVIAEVLFDTSRWTVPAQGLTSIITRCCWRGLARHVDHAEADEQFAGITIGVPQ